MADQERMLDRVSSSAVEDATGRGWAEWLELLDVAGAQDMDHKQIVAHVAETDPEVSSWWQQTIAVGYEQARGMRVVGETADTGFQVGVRRSADVELDAVWDLLVSRPDLWLGEGATVTFDEGATYDVPAGGSGPAATGEVRVVKPGNRLRLSWHPADWDAPATVQLRLSRTSTGKTTLGAHLEKLPDAEAREQMGERWRGAVERVLDAAVAEAG